MSKIGKQPSRVGGNLYRRFRVKKYPTGWTITTGARLPGRTTKSLKMVTPIQSTKRAGRTTFQIEPDDVMLPGDAGEVPGPNTSPRAFTGFDRERATYERHKAALLAEHEGEYVVIKGDDILGPMETYEDALRQGYARFGLGPIYVKQVLATEPVATTTRPVAPCPI